MGIAHAHSSSADRGLILVAVAEEVEFDGHGFLRFQRVENSSCCCGENAFSYPFDEVALYLFLRRVNNHNNNPGSAVGSLTRLHIAINSRFGAAADD